MTIPKWWTAPFRLLELPTELVLKIFRFTDLVAPSEIRWYRNTGVQSTLFAWQRRCSTCAQSGSDRVCNCPEDDSILSISDCSCWGLPSEIFLVNRQINEIATRLFFSKNHFVVRPEDPGDPSDGLSFVTFLESLPSRSLKYIRSIEFKYRRNILVGQGNYTRGLIGYSEETDWDSLAHFMLRNLDLTKLHIIVDSFADAYLDAQSDRESLLLEYIAWIGYQRMVTAFSRLKGLKMFHVYMSRAMVHYGHHVGNFSGNLEHGTIEHRLKAEMELERAVMGPRYDSEEEFKYCICPANPLKHRPETPESRTWICSKHRALGFYCDDDQNYRPKFCVGSG